jgi:hypothetical protein
MKAKLTVAAILFFSTLFSCNKPSEKDETTVYDTQIADLNTSSFAGNKKNEKQKIPVKKFQVPSTDSGSASQQAKPISNPDWDKKIIKTATLRLEVKDFKNYNNNVHQIVKQFGGYIAQEEQNLTDEKSETTVSIKVPVDQFESMMNQLPGGDIKVLERKITTEDVTGEMVDTRSRLEAKKQVRIKYLEFLKQSKNMEEVLQVQGEVNSIQEEIEAATGRVEFLSHQSSFSTINLTFFQPLAGYKPIDETPSFLTRVSGAFKTGASWIADLFVGLIGVWPLLLVVFGVYFGWKRMKPSQKIIPNT